MRAKTDPAPLLDIRHVTVLRGEVIALRRFSWRIRPGEHWVVLGPNGSGKSTLVQLLQGWIWAQSGKVSVLGRAFGADDIAELRQHVAWVGNEAEPEFPESQSVEHIVASGTVGTVGLRFDLPNARQRKTARAAVRALGLTHLARRPFRQLSQGQRRLAIIARAVAMRPDLLLLDEPANGLDPVARARFLERVARLLKPSGPPVVVYSTHHLDEVLPGFTHVLLMRRGRVVAAGPKAETLTSEKMRAAFGARFALPA